MSILFADSNCDLKQEQVNLFGIEYINMPFSCDEEGTKALDVDFYENTFRPYLEQGNNLVYIHQGEFYLKSYANLKKAVRRLKTEFPDNTIYLVDSETTSSGYAFVVYLSVLKYKTGCKDIDLINYVNQIKKEVVMLFTLTDAKGLQKHKININIDNALIKPIIKLENNKFGVVDKATNRKKIFEYFINGFSKYGENVADYPIFISYSGNDKDANELNNEICTVLGKDAKVMVNKLNAFDTYYTSTKTLSIAFHKKN